jgi:hypothetical protein
VPAVALALGGTLRAPLTAVIAAFEIALPVAVAGACFALSRAGGAERWSAFAAGLLGGTFAVHLASGWLATLAFAAAFLGALVVLAGREDGPQTDAVGGGRRTVAAATLLAAATASHPLFAVPGVAILAVAAAWSWSTARHDAVRIAGATVGAAVLVGAGAAALALGPGPLAVETSRDAFLRRAGLRDTLASAYLGRLVHRWARYVQWISVPLALAAWRTPASFVRRVLFAWFAVTVAGVAAAVLTRLAPPDRFLTFAFAIPMLAALGLERLRAALLARRDAAFRRRWGAATAIGVGALVAAMLAGSWIAWSRQEPFVDAAEVAAVTAANAVAAQAPPGTPLVVVVAPSEDPGTFEAARVGNVVRSAMPPDRIRDVAIEVPPAEEASPERDALARLTAADVARATAAAQEPAWRFVLRAFAPNRQDERAVPVAPGVAVSGVPVGFEPGAPVEPLEPASARSIVITALAMVGVFGVGGYGWARAAGLGSGARTAGVAPAFGWGAFALVAIALERLGVPLRGSVGPTLVSALALVGGFALRAILERRTGARAPDEVGEQPPE